MIHENVPISEAEKMVAEGARILEHRRNEEDQHVCLVETLEAPAKEAAAESEPKKRGRPKASKG